MSLRAGSSFGKGQMVSADYSLTPSITFSAKNTQGMGGALGGLGRGLGVLGAVAGGFHQNEASTMLLLTDNRSGVQVGAAEGSAAKVDFDVGAVLFGGYAGGGMGAYSNTPQGKVIVAAFTDSYNQLVRAVRNYAPQTMGNGQGLGTGGKLGVDGAAPPRPVATHMSVADAQRKLAALGYQPGPAMVQWAGIRPWRCARSRKTTTWRSPAASIRRRSPSWRNEPPADPADADRRAGV